MGSVCFFCDGELVRGSFGGVWLGRKGGEKRRSEDR